MASALYGIVDTARDRGLYERVAATLEHVCLFAGELPAPLRRTAPYLVNLSRNPDFVALWRRQWGQSWGILCASPADLVALRRHFRRFLQAKLPDGSVVLFRFYDPRVLRAYLPSCEAAQLRAWFACVDAFRVETDRGGTLLARLEADRLDVQEQPPTARPPATADRLGLVVP